VRKVVLEEPPGTSRLSDEKVTKRRRALFGSWEMNGLAYNFAHDVALPGATKGTVPFFMYPPVREPRTAGSTASTRTTQVPDHGAREI